MAALALATAEMGTVTAELKVFQAVRSKLLPAKRFNFDVGDYVRVFKEKDDKWCGPVNVIRARSKEVTVKEGAVVKTFGLSQVISEDLSYHDRYLKQWI